MCEPPILIIVHHLQKSDKTTFLICGFCFWQWVHERKKNQKEKKGKIWVKDEEQQRPEGYKL